MLFPQHLVFNQHGAILNTKYVSVDVNEAQEIARISNHSVENEARLSEASPSQMSQLSVFQQWRSSWPVESLYKHFNSGVSK
jgi:hypothetical protein